MLGAGVTISLPGCVGNGVGNALETDSAQTTTEGTSEPTLTETETEITVSVEGSTETPVQGTLEPPSVEKEDWSDDTSQQTSVTIGSRSQLEGDQPHWLLIWNDSPDRRRIQVQVAPAAHPEEATFDETYRIDPGAYITVGVMRPGEYVFCVGVADTTLESVGGARVDCNDSETRIRVRSDESIDWSGLSNTAMCETVVNSTAT